MKRENQTFIGLRLDPDLLAAVDAKRAKTRQTRSQFIRDAIYEAVKEFGLPEHVAFPQDRVGESRGGRPRKQIQAVPGAGKPAKVSAQSRKPASAS